MSKKKKAKHSNPNTESPEKAIINRGRNLEIHECLINSNWILSKDAQILVSRKHVNGNITFAIYIVDLLAGGLLETFYQYNVTETDYKEYKEELVNEFELVNYSYATLHNIIYGAIDFAENYGIKPDPDFGVTKYLLEDDTDDIPLVNVHFGYKGKPLILKLEGASITKAEKVFLKRNIPNEYDVIHLNEKRPGYLDVENEIFKEDYGLEVRDFERIISGRLNNIEELETVVEFGFFQKIKDYPEFAEQNKIKIGIRELLVEDVSEIEKNNDDLTDREEQIISMYSEIIFKKKIRKLRKKIATLEKEVTEKPTVFLLSLLLTAWSVLDDWNKYNRVLDQALKQFPDDTNLLFFKCESLLNQKKPEEIPLVFNNCYTLGDYFTLKKVDTANALNFYKYLFNYFLHAEKNIRQAQVYFTAIVMMNEDKLTSDFVELKYKLFFHQLAELVGKEKLKKAIGRKKWELVFNE